MSARQASPYLAIARKWLALAERRKAHFIELYNSGRWKHYYTQSELHDEMRKIDLLCDQWARLAGLARPPRRWPSLPPVPPPSPPVRGFAVG